MINICVFWGSIFYFTMIIAIPTGIKIFSWLLSSFSKNTSMAINIIINKETQLLSKPILQSSMIPFFNNISLFKVFPRSNRIYITPNTISKDIVVYGNNLESTTKYKFYTDIMRYMVNIPNNIIYVLVGLLLSDGCITIGKNKNFIKSEYKKEIEKLHSGKLIYNEKGLLLDKNARFRIKQSIEKYEYIFYLNNILSHYCQSQPFFTKSQVNRKTFYGIELVTRALPCFYYLYTKFYNGDKKVIPLDIYDYLNYESLAHWIMGDGSYTNKGIILHTQCFTLQECIYLLNILKIKFDLDCSIHTQRKQYIIYIRVHSVKKLIPHIKKYMISSMMYKIGS
jgi:LAGLIDADG DNA endonuclease family